MILIISPLWRLKSQLNAMSDKECRGNDYCKRLRWRLVIDHSKCPSPHPLVQSGLLHGEPTTPRGLWWNFQGTNICYWFHSGRKIIHERLSKQSEKVSWYEAKKRCASIHPRAKLLSVQSPDAFTAVTEHLMMIQRLLTRRAQNDQNMTFSNGLDYWIGLRRCKKNAQRYDFSLYVEDGSAQSFCDLEIKKKGSGDVENGTLSYYSYCKKDAVGWLQMPGLGKHLKPELWEKIKKAGVKIIQRDAMMEEHAALVSYTEFESWWSSIYESRDQLKAFETPHVHEDYFEPCPGDTITEEEKKFQTDSLFQSFCVKLSPGLKNTKLFPELFHLFPENMTAKEKKKLHVSPVKSFTAYSVPCDWKLNYICELDCDPNKHKDCHPTGTYGNE